MTTDAVITWAAKMSVKANCLLGEKKMKVFFTFDFTFLHGTVLCRWPFSWKKQVHYQIGDEEDLPGVTWPRQASGQSHHITSLLSTFAVADHASIFSHNKTTRVGIFFCPFSKHIPAIIAPAVHCSWTMLHITFFRQFFFFFLDLTKDIDVRYPSCFSLNRF